MTTFYQVVSLNADQRTQLTTEGIPLYSDFTDGSDPQSVLLQAQDIDRALAILNPISKEVSASGTQHVSKLVLTFAAAVAAQAEQPVSAGEVGSHVEPEKPKVEVKPVEQPKPAPPPKVVRDPVLEAKRNGYIQACNARLGELVEQGRQQLVDQRKQIESLQAQIIHHLRAKRIASRRAAGQPFCDRQEFAAEFDALLQVPKVNSVRVDLGVVSVFTDTLFNTDPRTGTKHEIGRFQIQIFLNGEADSIRWLNLSRRINGCRAEMQAPHILTSGRACLNEIREAFPDLIANLQISVVAQLAIDFLEQIDVDHPTGEKVNCWPAGH